MSHSRAKHPIYKISVINDVRRLVSYMGDLASFALRAVQCVPPRTDSHHQSIHQRQFWHGPVDVIHVLFVLCLYYLASFPRCVVHKHQTVCCARPTLQDGTNVKSCFALPVGGQAQGLGRANVSFCFEVQLFLGFAHHLRDILRYRTPEMVKRRVATDVVTRQGVANA